VEQETKIVPGLGWF